MNVKFTRINPLARSASGGVNSRLGGQMTRHRRQLAMDFMERTPEQRDIRRAVGDMIAGNYGNAKKTYDRYRIEIDPGDLTYNSFTAAGQPSGIACIPIDNAVHLARAAGSVQVFDVIAQHLGLAIYPITASQDPCVRELALQCSNFLANYHGQRPTDNQLMDAAYAVLRPAAALVKGVK